MVAEPHQAGAIVAGGEADMVALARAIMDDPRWPGARRVPLAPRPRTRTCTSAVTRVAGPLPVPRAAE